MKRFLIPALCVSLAVIACSRQPKTKCQNGNQMPPETLDSARQIGDNLIAALENQEFDKIYDAAGEDLRKAQTREQFKLVLQGTINNLSSLEFSRLSEAYYLTSKAGKKFPVVNIPCSLEMENVNDLYQAPANRELAALIYGSMAGQEGAHIFVELLKEGGSWKLFSIVPGLETLKHKNVDEFINLARQAREQNHPRLALLYYKIAFLLSDYSPNVTEFVSLKVAQEMSQVKTDYLPSGVPQLWTLPDNSNYTVFNADIYIENDEPWINIDWLVDSFADTNKLDQDSEKLLGFSLDKFAEANEFFVGVIVTAHSQDPKLINQVFRKFRRFPQKPQ